MGGDSEQNGDEQFHKSIGTMKRSIEPLSQKNGTEWNSVPAKASPTLQATVGGAKPSRYLRERICWFAFSLLLKRKFAASQRSSTPGKRVAFTASNAGSVMRQPIWNGVHSGF